MCRHQARIHIEIYYPCQDRKFVEQDKCEVCQDVQLEMYPNMTFEELCALYHSKVKSKDETDKAEAKEIGAAIARKAQMIQDGMTQDLRPSSDVFMENSYGYMIFQDVGLATKDDIHRWTNQTPRVLGIQGFKLKLDWPERPATELFPVSLVGLPLDELMGIRKSRQYTDTSITRDEFHLLHDYQLAKSQSNTLFGFLSDTFSKQRPAKLSGGLGTVMTKADLEEKARKIDSKAAANLESGAVAASESALADPSDSDSVDSDGVAQRKAKRKSYDLGQLAAPDAKSKAKAKAKSKLRGKGGSKTKKGSEDEENPDESNQDQEVESSVGGKKADEIAQLDTDLKDVAMDHLSTNRNASIACFKKLTVTQFLEESKLGQTLHGARGCQTSFSSKKVWETRENHIIVPPIVLEFEYDIMVGFGSNFQGFALLVSCLMCV